MLDMNDVDMLDACTQKFDAVQPGLLQSIISKDIVKNEKYVIGNLCLKNCSWIYICKL